MWIAKETQFLIWFYTFQTPKETKRRPAHKQTHSFEAIKQNKLHERIECIGNYSSGNIAEKAIANNIFPLFLVCLLFLFRPEFRPATHRILLEEGVEGYWQQQKEMQKKIAST